MRGLNRNRWGFHGIGEAMTTGLYGDSYVQQTVIFHDFVVRP